MTPLASNTDANKRTSRVVTSTRSHQLRGRGSADMATIGQPEGGGSHNLRARWERYGTPFLPWVAGWLALTVGMWRWPKTGVGGFDASYAVVWSRDLYVWRPGVLPEGSPTPHPLGVLFAFPLNLLQDSTAPLVAATAAAYAAAILVFASLAYVAVGEARRTRYVGVAVTVLLVVCSPNLTLLAKQASPDVWFILMVGVAASAFLCNRPGVAVVLFALASLQRPEAWLFGVATAVLASRATRVSRGRRALRSGWAWWGYLAASPILWVAMGTWFHQPLAGLESSQNNAETLHRSTGLGAAIGGLLPNLASGVGWGVVVIGLLAATWNLTSRPSEPPPRRTALRPPALGAPATRHALGYLTLLLTIDIGFFLAEGVLGVALLPRYLATAQFLLATLCGITLAVLASRVIHMPGDAGKPAARSALVATLIAAAMAVALVVSGARGAAQYRSLGPLLQTQHSIEDSLTRALNQEQQPRACGRTVYTVVLAQTPVIALHTGQRLSDIHAYTDATAATTTRGTLVFPRDRAALDGAGFGPAQPAVAQIAIPTGFRVVATDTHWVVIQRC